MNTKKWGAAGLIGAAVIGATMLGSGTRAADPVKIRLVEVITNPDRTVLLKGILADFEKANPGISVELVSYPFEQSFEKLLSSVQAGDAPDVVEMADKWVGLFGAAGNLLDMGPYAKSWPSYKKLSKKIIEAGSIYKNTLYTLPYGFYIRAMFYNKKMFADKKLQPPRTLADFDRAIKLLTDPAKNQYGYCLRGARGIWDNVNYFIQGYAGSNDWFDDKGNSTLTQPDAIKGLEAFANIYKNGYAPKASISWGFNDIVTGFYSGNCAMLDQDPDALGDVGKKMDEADFGVAPMPVGPKGKGYLKPGFAGWSIFKTTKNADAAWKLTSYLESPEVNLKWVKFFGIIPAYTDAQNDPLYSKPIYKGWFDELKSTRYKVGLYPFDLPELGYFIDVLCVQEMNKLMLGQQTAEETAKVMADYLTKAKQKQMGTK
jgi:multiple sugar transport system substrate-binding protein